MKAEPAVALAHLDAALEHIQARARSTGKLELLSSKPYQSILEAKRLIDEDMKASAAAASQIDPPPPRPNPRSRCWSLFTFA